MQHSIRCESQAAAEMEPVGDRRPGLEDRGHIREHGPRTQFGARDPRRRPTPGRRRIGKKEDPVGGKTRMQAQVEQTALPHRPYRRDAAHLLHPAVARDEPQPSGALADQQPAVRKERDRPGILETGCDGPGAQPMNRLPARSARRRGCRCACQQNEATR
jgi:hypothetical protein